MNRIAELRKQKGLSQKEFAEFLKISPGNLCEWEKGRIEPSVEFLNIIADYFDVSIDYLVGRTDDFDVTRNKFMPEEEKLLQYFRGMSETEKRAVLVTAKAFYDRHIE